MDVNILYHAISLHHVGRCPFVIAAAIATTIAIVIASAIATAIYHHSFPYG